MSHISMTERVLAAVRPIEGLLCHVLLDAVTTADAAATGRLELPRTAPYQPVRVHMARARARKSLEDEVIPGWFVNDLERQNTALHMYTAGIAMRFLHTPTGVTPAPGPNRARRAWYTAALDGLEENMVPDEIKLIALWSADFQAGLVDVRVVRPVRTWAYGGKEKVDISIPLDAGASFTSQGYDPRDDEEELPFPSREEAAEEEDGDSSAAR